MEKAFFDYLYFKVIHAAENKIIELLKSKKIPFNSSLDKNNQLIIKILTSDNISIINQTLKPILQQQLDELVERIFSEIENKIQEAYQEIAFTEFNLKPLIVQIIQSRYNAVFHNNKELLVFERIINSQYPKCFIEYHLREYIVSLACDRQEQTSKEKIDHQIRRQKFIRDHHISNDFADMGKKLSDISSNYVENLVKNPHKNQQCIKEFIRNTEHLNNHLCYVLSHPSFFTKEELASLKILQQNTKALITQTKTAAIDFDKRL